MKNTALIVVDMQDFFLKNLGAENRNKLISNQINIINFFIKNKSNIIFLEYQDIKTTR